MHHPIVFRHTRTFVEIYAKENNLLNDIKIISKTPEYLEFVTKTIFIRNCIWTSWKHVHRFNILGLLSHIVFSISK
jgi:hypothetical protein